MFVVNKEEKKHYQKVRRWRMESRPNETPKKPNFTKLSPGQPINRQK